MATNAHRRGTEYQTARARTLEKRFGFPSVSRLERGLDTPQRDDARLPTKGRGGREQLTTQYFSLSLSENLLCLGTSH